MALVARALCADRVVPDAMDRFIADFSALQLDEVLGAFEPYRQVVADALMRARRLNGVEYLESDADTVYAAVPTWGPHPDVPEALTRVAREISGVSLTNSMIDLIPPSIETLGVPFHKVITAEETGADKPRIKGFESMIDALGARPEEVMHCSSSVRYDLMTAHDMRFGRRVFVNRGHEPSNPAYATDEIADLRGLPGLLGL